MTVEVNFASFLTKLVEDNKILNYFPGKLSDILLKIAEQYPVFKKEVFDNKGNLKDHILIFIDGKDFRQLMGINTFVEDNQEIKIYLVPMGG